MSQSQPPWSTYMFWRTRLSKSKYHFSWLKVSLSNTSEPVCAKCSSRISIKSSGQNTRLIYIYWKREEQAHNINFTTLDLTFVRVIGLLASFLEIWAFPLEMAQVMGWVTRTHLACSDSPSSTGLEQIGHIRQPEAQGIRSTVWTTHWDSCANVS